jgi:hypothetical protein
MSRGKRIVVNEDEWIRLQAAASKLRDLNQNLPGLLDDVRRATQQDLQRNISAVQARQQAFDQALAGVNTDVRDIERRASQRFTAQAKRMAEQQATLTARIDATAAELRQETQTLIAAERAETEQALALERSERARQVTHLREGLNVLLSDQARAAQVAQEWLTAATTVRSYIRGQLEHERFAPGELQRLEQRLDLAAGNVASGLSEAAISAAQETYLQLSELRADLELRESEWRAMRANAAAGLKILSGLVAQNRERAGVNQDGTENETVLDVNWWSNGKLSRLGTQVDELLNRVTDERNPVPTQELQNIIDVRAPQLEKQLSEIAQEAGAQQLASQVRANILQTVVQVLEENGYGLDDYTYAGNDFRDMLVAKVQHADGSEIVVRVAPVPGDPPGCELDIDSYDQFTANEDVLWERARALANRLREEGIQVHDPQETGAPDPEVTDIEKVRTTPTVVPQTRSRPQAL